MKIAIALVKDFELFSTLQTELKAFGITLKSVLTADSACDELRKQDSLLVFIDLRECIENHEEAQLVHRLAANEFSAINVVSVVKSCLPMHCAAQAEMISASFVAFRNNGELKTLRVEDSAS